MKEVTRIIDVQITTIQKIDDEEYKELDRNEFEEAFKDYIECDDVKVKDVKDFILDLEN